MKQFHAIISGRVQGVCFRAETVAVGRRLGLNGYARNLPDGSVEVAASGSDEKLKELEAFLHHGPTLARVTELKIDWDDDRPIEHAFQVRY